MEPKRPNLWQRVRIWIGNHIPIENYVPFGLLTLVVRRGVLQELNLLPAPDAPDAVPAEPVPDYRTADGAGTDPTDVYAGAQNTPFGRNMPPAAGKHDPLRDPPVQLVAQRLLARRRFQPAGMQLNVLAAAWIQFMTHDWVSGVQTDEDVTLDSGGPRCPLRSFTFKRTEISEAGTVRNARTHWWDQSVVYGQNADDLRSIRAFQGGKLIVGKARGVMPRRENGTLLAGDNRNSWAGVQLLQELFIREHNAVADFVAQQHPELRDNDERLFNVARLVVAAIAAKIHTTDWTCELLKTKVLKVGMTTNWYGLWRGLGICKKGPPGPASLVGKTTNLHGVPFSLTEEFVAVYRMHPLIPDGLPLASGSVPIDALIGRSGEEFVSSEVKAVEVWNAIVRYPCGALVPFNYPRALRVLTPTTADGTPVDHMIDLAALDLYRDRERGIRLYNDFRSALHLPKFKNYEDLVGGDKPDQVQALEEVYGKDGIDKLDLLVGNMFEKKIPGFALPETSFIIFLLMASRRLESDRFLNENFNEETYTKAGLTWVKRVEGMRDVLVRHFPEMSSIVGEKASAFTPTTAWPAVFLQEQE